MASNLAINGVSHAHVSIHALFSLGLRFLHSLFSIIGILGVRLSHVWQLLRAISYVQNFLYFFSEQKIKFDDFHVFKIMIGAWHETSCTS